jgi:hypothetical protein
MSMIQFDINQYQNIRETIRMEPEFAKVFLRTFLQVADHLLKTGSARTLTKTAQQLNITAPEIMQGIIEGCLNEQLINENLAPILGKELLPIALLTLKNNSETAEEVYFNWRKWYHMQRHNQVNAETISEVIANIMKYARFLDFDKLTEALESNQLITFKALPMEQAKLLRFYPALRYQKDVLGELKVGTFFTDRQAGFFNCGEIEESDTHCLACGRRDLQKAKYTEHIYCRACNAGYKPKGENNK